MPQVTKNLRDSTIVMNDNVAETITLAIEEGDLAYTEADGVVRVLDRGDLSHMRQGDEAAVEGSMSMKYVEFIKQTGAVNPTAYEALSQTGGAAAWVSTNADGGDVYTLEMVVTIVSPTTGEDDETITFAFLHAENIEFNEGDEYNTLSFTFLDWEVRPSYAKV